MNSGFARMAAIVTAFILGGLLPQAHIGAWLIRWLIMGMLFVVFLQTRWTRHSLHPSHAILLFVNFFMGFAGLALGWLVGGRDVGLAAFFAGITPTASAAPVIISFMHGRVDYVITAFLLTNCTISALLPFLLPLVLGESTPTAFTAVLGSVSLVIFVPLLAAWLVRRLHPPAALWPRHLRNLSFAAWVCSLFLVTANGSYFIRAQSGLSPVVLVEIAAATLTICIANFALGRWIGGKDYAREASQSLGQKNTSFTIYLALTYASPLIALGPTCYVLWHNLWNSWQLHRARPPGDGVVQRR